MVQSPSWEANRLSSSLEITHHPNAASHFLKIHFNILSHLRLVFQVVSFPQVAPPKALYAPFLSYIRATCPTHPILCDLITRIIFGEEYGSYCSSLGSILTLYCYHIRVKFSYLLQHCSLCFCLSFTPIKKKNKVVVLYTLIFVFLDRY